MSKEEYRLISDIIERDITKCTLQLYRIVDGHFISFGSAVLIMIGDEHWLLTASHVSKTYSEGQELFFQYQINEFISIAGLFGETPFPDSSQIDFTIVKLDRLCAAKLKQIKVFLNPKNTCLLQDQFKKQLMVVCGFPSVATDTSTPVIKSRGNYFLTNTSNEKPYEYYGFNPIQFIIVDFAGKGYDVKTGQKIKTNEPYGMSGGGLWKIWKNENENDYNFCLTGIVTETRNGKYHVIIANKIYLMLDKIYESLT